ncbi:hypothetical protein PHMEG_0001067 [Phytophthora megakarya]|uniref:Transmembrane protein n=1 Tax=Phytophthora megakarya TaxID=4795 RepID=A0A225X2T0_9STRA|nr:hypothetical protein PHMEG_0001067 [Phytophthora megakarya]
MGLSSSWFTFWWLVIFNIYLTVALYNAGYAKFYWDLDGTFLNIILEEHGVGMDSTNYHTIVYVYMALSLLHGVSAMLMVVGSICRRKLVFSPWKSNFNKVARKSNEISSKSTAYRRDYFVQFSSTCMKFVGKYSSFGVHGRHFHDVLICRELLETTLQTIQAVRMSKYLPRILLNRFYVCLLACNCWSSVIINSRWFYKDEARQRLALVMSDCAVDLMSTLGVSILVVFSYIGQYNKELSGFGPDQLQDDEWMARMLNEAQMVLVVSWFDLMSRIIFSLGLVATISESKTLLSDVFTSKTQDEHVADPLAFLNKSPVTIVPATSDNTIIGCPFTHSKEKFSRQRLPNKNKKTPLASFSFFVRNLVHVVFTVWGIAIVALHVHAITQHPLVECAPKVYPIAGALPSCYVVNFDCNSLNLLATIEEMNTEWGKFDGTTVVKLQIRHCPAVDMPARFNSFTRLQEILVYNSTIVNWRATAAVTNTYHPKLSSVTFIRVNMTDGLLSAGLQSVDFPNNLHTLYFCETNLHTLPTDIDSIWMKGSYIYLQNTRMEEIPLALVRLRPIFLVFAGSPITALPSELFEGEIQYLVLSQTKIGELPQEAELSATLNHLDVTNTNISFFWSWIDTFVQNTLNYSSQIAAGGTTYCSDIEQITNGTTTNFTTPFRIGYSPLLMNPSESNWELLRKVVDCSPPTWDTDVQLQWWDEKYGIITCMGVTLIVVLSYLPQYDTTTTNFGVNPWYNNEWAARALELQMVVVVSWSDRFGRTIFSLRLLMTTTNLKKLLYHPGKKHTEPSPVKMVFTSKVKLEPQSNENNLENYKDPSSPVLSKKTYHRLDANSLTCRAWETFMYAVHLAFFMWGLAILGFHIEASI